VVAILNSLFRRAHGYLVTSDPDPTKSQGQKALVEKHTITCGHNGELVDVPANCPAEKMPYTLCWGCRRHICIACAQEMDRTGKCDVIENKLERMEARDRFAQDVLGR
jgi:hypothetical protein